jgi:hypothetical protein
MNAQSDTLSMLAATVDQLAVIKAELAELAAKEKALKAILAESHFERIEGTLHRASVSHCEGRVTVDWETIARRFNPSHQLIAAHTSQGAPYAVVRVSARKGA